MRTTESQEIILFFDYIIHCENTKIHCLTHYTLRDKIYIISTILMLALTLTDHQERRFV